MHRQPNNPVRASTEEAYNVGRKAHTFGNTPSGEIESTTTVAVSSTVAIIGPSLFAFVPLQIRRKRREVAKPWENKEHASKRVIYQ